MRDAVREERGGRYDRLDDGRKLVAEERGGSLESFSREDYLKWFAETLGKQLAIIHNSGYNHGYFTDHNVTLDCRIVDLDSVTALDKREDKKVAELKGDYYGASNILRKLSKVIRADSAVTRGILRKCYQESLHSDLAPLFPKMTKIF